MFPNARMKNKRRIFCVLFLGLSVFSVLLVAAQSLSIFGRVVDSEGAPVTGVVMTLRSDANAFRTTNPSGNGEFAFAQLVPGEYTLRVEATRGLAPWTQVVSLTTNDVNLTVVLRSSQ
jgi:hypothetical protein